MWRPDPNFVKAIIEDGRVVKIGVEFFGNNAFYCAPLYKFSKTDFLYWLSEIEKFIKKGNVRIYAEDVFKKISDKVVLHPLYFNNETCMEIDTKEDLKIADNSISL